MRGRKPAAIVAGSSPIADVPKAPAWLSKDARAVWKQVAAILVERKVLTDADLGTLESYCTATGAVRECQRTINVEGLTIGGKRHPLLTTQNAAMQTARLCAAELGLTPVARSRTAIAENDHDDDTAALGL